MKAFKVELLIIDLDQIGKQNIIAELENTKYANHCISPQVMKVIEADIGEYNDEHPLNNHNTYKSEYNRLFPK